MSSLPLGLSTDDAVDKIAEPGEDNSLTGRSDEHAVRCMSLRAAGPVVPLLTGHARHREATLTTAITGAACYISLCCSARAERTTGT